MDIISILAVAIALAMDAFSVSITAGIIIENPDFSHYFRLAFHFGLFQFMMPVVGYLAGMYMESYIRDYDHWLAFILLVLIGLKMIKDSFNDSDIKREDPSKGGTLLLLSIATSIDAMAVGLTLGVLNRPILFPSIVIGLVCSIFSIIGITIGKKVGDIIGKRAEITGGIMLILIGTKILVEHIFF